MPDKMFEVHFNCFLGLANTPTPTLSKEPRLNPMYAGERANFTCHVDVSSGWEYYWRKDGNDLAETGKTISVSLDPSNGGKYLCHAIRGESTSTKLSEEITQDVLGRWKIYIISHCSRLEHKCLWINVRFQIYYIQIKSFLSRANEDFYRLLWKWSLLNHFLYTLQLNAPSVETGCCGVE